MNGIIVQKRDADYCYTVPPMVILQYYTDCFMLSKYNQNPLTFLLVLRLFVCSWVLHLVYSVMTCSLK